MHIKDRALRELSLVVSLALISTSFGPEAWAQTVPLLGRLPAPVDRIAVKTDPLNAPDFKNAATAASPTAEDAVAGPPTIPFDFASPPPAEAEPPTAVPTASTAAGKTSKTGRKPRMSVPDWEVRREVLLSQAQEIRDRLDEHAHRRERDADPEEFDRELKDNAVSLEEPALGKAKLTLIDGRRIVHVVNSSSELSFLFLDTDAVSRDSRHLRQFIARQFFDAGSDRTDGRRGRDAVVVVWQKDGRAIETRFHQKPVFPSRDWWRQYWRATAKAPTWESLKLGLFWGSVQGLLALGVAVLNHMLTGIPVFPAPIMLAFASGTLIPIFISTYKNWTYRGSALSQTAKLAAISIFLAYSAVFLTKGFVALTLAGNLLILFNVVLKSTTKAPWLAIPRMFEKHQREKANLPLFWGFKTGNMLNQGFYQIGSTLRLIALLIPEGLGYASLVMGYAPLAVGMAIAMWASYLYARRHGYPEAEQILRGPRLALRWGRDALKRLFR